MSTNSDSKIKEVVLLTWKGGGNYGSCLQSYALHKKLESIGYRVQFISAGFNGFGIKDKVKYIISCIGLLKVYRFFQWLKADLKSKKRIRFQKQTINEIELYSNSQLNKIVLQTDCFVTGSDQIWNTYHNYKPFNFLSFAGDTKRIAYASSIGTNRIKKECEEEVKNLLLKFSHIGVRENEAVRVLSELTGRTDIRQVIDPTFLLTPSEWNSILEKPVFEIEIPNNYILCYLIGNNQYYSKNLEDVKDKLGTKNIIIIPSAESPCFDLKGACVYNDAGPVEFLSLLSHAQYVCTDSFHATALSINFSVPFVEFMRFNDDDPNSQNSRIYDVLNHYGLMNYIYKSNSKEWQKPIDYARVQEILQMDRKDSEGFLIQSIEN